MSDAEKNWRRAKAAQKLAIHFSVLSVKQFLKNPGKTIQGAAIFILGSTAWLVRSCVSILYCGIKSICMALILSVLFIHIYIVAIVTVTFLCIIYWAFNLLTIVALGVSVLIYIFGFYGAFLYGLFALLRYELFYPGDEVIVIAGLGAGAGALYALLAKYWGDPGDPDEYFGFKDRSWDPDNLHDLVHDLIVWLSRLILGMTDVGFTVLIDFMASSGRLFAKGASTFASLAKSAFVALATQFFKLTSLLKRFFIFLLTYSPNCSTWRNNTKEDETLVRPPLQSSEQCDDEINDKQNQANTKLFDFLGLSVVQVSRSSFQLISLGLISFSTFSLSVVGGTTLISVVIFEWPISIDDISAGMEKIQSVEKTQPFSTVELVEMYQTSDLIRSPTYWQFSSYSELKRADGTAATTGSILQPKSSLCSFQLIVAVGSASPPGSDDLNLRLSQNRALHVASSLWHHIAHCNRGNMIIASWTGENRTNVPLGEELRLVLFGVEKPSERISTSYLNSLVSSFLFDADIGTVNRADFTIKYCVHEKTPSGISPILSSNIAPCN